MKFKVTSIVACSFLLACLTFAQESGEAVTVSISNTTTSSKVTDAEAKMAQVQKDFKMLQGDWKFGGSNSYRLGKDSSSVDHFLNAATLADKFQISQNHVSADSRCNSERATMVIDFSGLDFKSLAEKKLSNGNLIMFILPSGKPFLASYNVNEEGLTLRYPAGSCSRSGWAGNFARVKPATSKK